MGRETSLSCVSLLLLVVPPPQDTSLPRNAACPWAHDPHSRVCSVLLPGWGHVPMFLRGFILFWGFPVTLGKSSPCWPQYPHSESERSVVLTPEGPLTSALWIRCCSGLHVHSQGSLQTQPPLRAALPLMSAHSFVINVQPHANHKVSLETKLIYFRSCRRHWSPSHPGRGAAALPLPLSEPLSALAGRQS